MDPTQRRQLILERMRAAVGRSAGGLVTHRTEWNGIDPLFPAVHWLECAGAQLDLAPVSVEWSAEDLAALVASGALRVVRRWQNPKDEFESWTEYEVEAGATSLAGPSPAGRLVALIDAVRGALDGGAAAVARVLATGEAPALVRGHEVRSTRFATLALADELAVDRGELSRLLQLVAGGVHDHLELVSPSNVPPSHWGDLPETEVLRMPWGHLGLGSTHGNSRLRTLSIQCYPPRPPARGRPPLAPPPTSELCLLAERAAFAVWQNLELSLRRHLAIRTPEAWALEASPLSALVSPGPVEFSICARERTGQRRLAPFARVGMRAESGWITFVEATARRLREAGAPGAPSGLSLADDPEPFASSIQAPDLGGLEREARRALQPLWRQSDPSLWFDEPGPAKASPPLKTVDGWTLTLQPLPLPSAWPPAREGHVDLVGSASRPESATTREETAPFGQVTFDVRTGQLLRLAPLGSPDAVPVRAPGPLRGTPCPVSPRDVLARLRELAEREQPGDLEPLRPTYRWFFSGDARLAELRTAHAPLVSWALQPAPGR